MVLVDVRTVTYNRRLRDLNNRIIDEYVDFVDSNLGTGVSSTPVNPADKYKDSIGACILGMFTVAFTANQSVDFQQSVYRVAEQEASSYVETLRESFDNAYQRLDDVSIDASAYKELRDSGADILTTLNVKDEEHAKPYTEISPLLIRNTFDNRVAMTQSLADYTYFSNVLDYNGNPLYTEKYWIWSQAEDTRHSEMDGETVFIDEMFVVTNEVTGEEDEGRFPRDYDNMSPSNAYNCLCDIGYLVDGH